MVYVMSGHATSIHLPRLEHIVASLAERGLRACFDMEQVKSLEAGVIRFFAEGAGRECLVVSPPEPLRSLRAAACGATRPAGGRP